MYTDNYGYIGSRATGNGAGCYLVAGPGSLITPGFGGRVYFPTGKGFIVLQVVPKPAAPAGK
jgi:hypothetical protein